MPDNDPTKTGGLFIGRRPGTHPMRYRDKPVTAGETRRRLDSPLAAVILVAETLLCLTLWGPQPTGWLWIGSQLNHETNSVSLGIAVAFIGMILTMVATIGLTMRLDHAWKLVRRAGGHEQKDGAINRIFVISGAIVASAFLFWFLIIHGPGSSVGPNN